jgi:glycosyltransferase involved in cell wall biosynthesis
MLLKNPSIQVDQPTCSVVIAAYNEERYLNDTLASILSQQGVDLEIVFVDDRSTDETLSIATNISRVDRRLKVYQSPKKGKCSAFNFGVGVASGIYICIFSGDDLMPQGSLRMRLDSIKPLGTAVPVVGLSKLITMADRQRYNGVLIPRARGVGALCGTSPLMNRLASRLVFPVPESLPNEDTWMSLVLTHLKDIAIVHSDVISCKWRMHSGNSISMADSFTEYGRKIADRNRALIFFLEKFGENLEVAERKLVEEKIYCERMRAKGSVMGVMLMNLSLAYRLRVLSITNRFMYGVRRLFYAFLGGR